ncbi:MAG: potassium channel protein [Nitrososphaerota archaeon]|uniref:potassium channel family protein n=1 Tax=Candidatus Bathycorpusculum sp. TaxID=2994959 RepID=UPI00281BFE2F|nr:potassium channel protein [Candidatus Termitimicrobium sp.]MDR0493134.1 potassium channel protein [Nitrososphaerota archaeon]
MKNISELMIDLAYSAALYNDKDLAEDVLTLEYRVDNLAYLLEMEIMLAARDPKDAEQLIGVSTVAASADKISDAAGDIAAIVTRGIGIHPIIGEIFKKVEERLMKVTVQPNSSLIEKQIGELDLAASMGVDIIAIRRNHDWILNPNKQERVYQEDILITRGAPSGIEEFKDLAEGNLATMDTENRVKFEEIVSRFVELKDTSELMMDLAYSALMLNSKDLAEEVERLEERMDDMHTDFELLALTSGFKNEEAPGFLGLIRLGMATEKIADAATEIAEVVLRGIEPHPILMLAIREAEETVMQACVTSDSPLIGKSLKEARVHDETGMWVLVIKRDDRCVRPRPDTKIRAGDILVASGYAEGTDALKRLAAPTQEYDSEDTENT